MNTHITHQKLFKNGLLFGALLLGLGLSIKEATPAKAVTANFNGPVYRLYNPNSGEHVYTMGLTEKNNLVHLGWGYEGVLGTSYYTMNGQNYDKIPVYRLYSKNSGQHFYTKSIEETAFLTKIGWNDEGVAFCFSSPEPPQSGPLSPA
ncbi:glycoside hydrolase, family 25 [Lactococcus lactis]|uniref:glycoside hydrolase, family 25 n=1 Tax=Lactococcus lactis TaxID=1358 RepID=UPI0035BBD8B1